jgi:MoxR-like ATPase
METHLFRAVVGNISKEKDGIDAQSVSPKKSMQAMLLRMLICVVLRIPILVIGGPGTGKSFSVGILLKALKGYLST